MTRRELRVPVDGGDLVGWVQGHGARVLLLHGGPGLNYDYLDGLAADLGEGYEVASYQQRGLAPSLESGPFDIATQVEDVRRVLDGLGWDRAYVTGHSWGGHLALHVATALTDRLHGVLIVDPLGAVGDGGEKEFEAEMFARTPADVRERARELDERAMRGEGSPDDMIESMRLVWPAYFPSWNDAPAMPELRASAECYAGTFASIHEELPRLEAALPTISVPVGFVAGAASPMPTSSSEESAQRIPGAWVEIVRDAGHFPWMDSPGSISHALDRLTGG